MTFEHRLRASSLDCFFFGGAEIVDLLVGGFLDALGKVGLGNCRSEFAASIACYLAFACGLLTGFLAGFCRGWSWSSETLSHCEEPKSLCLSSSVHAADEGKLRFEIGYS